jgi:hypothetical protein
MSLRQMGEFSNSNFPKLDPITGEDPVPEAALSSLLVFVPAPHPAELAGFPDPGTSTFWPHCKRRQ